MPGVARPSERIKNPGLTRCFDCLAFFIGICITSYENDFAKTDYLSYLINLGQRNNWSGRWEIIRQMVNYFNLDISKEKNLAASDSVFDIVELFNFLSQYFSVDEIFGNLLKRAVILVCNLYKLEDRYKASLSKVNYPQRKRGYTDKGSLAPFDSRARKEANITTDTRQRMEFRSLEEIVIWHPPIKK